MYCISVIYWFTSGLHGCTGIVKKTKQDYIRFTSGLHQVYIDKNCN
jgi:hypothetical protein